MQVYPLNAKQARGTSPGISDLDRLGMPMSWFQLDAGKSVEFEVLDGTGRARVKDGASAFVRLSADETPIEIFSESCVVPALMLLFTESDFLSRFHCLPAPSKGYNFAAFPYIALNFWFGDHRI